MKRSRGVRVGAGLFLVAFGLLGSAPAAHAATPQGEWTNPEPTDSDGGMPVVRIEAQGSYAGTAEFAEGIERVTFRLLEDAVDDAVDPCSAKGSVPDQTVEGGGATSLTFSFEAWFPCNRTYEVLATVHPVDRPLRDDSPQSLPLRVIAAVPPRPTTGLTATPVEETVLLRWDEVTHEPDFLGYEIRRSTNGGSFTTIGETGSGASSFTDADLPAEGGTFRYTVIGVRAGPDPDSTVTATEGPTAEATVVPVSDDDPATPGDGGGNGGGTGDGSGGTDATSDGSGDTAGGATPGGGVSRPRGSPGSRSVSRVIPPTTLTTLDTGFQQTLPFRPRQQVEAVDEPTVGQTTAVAVLDDDTGESNQRQTMLLVAGGSAAFSWALALRFVSRKAAIPL